MTKKRRSIGELELEVLNAIRSRKRASVHEVCQSMRNEPKYTTVLTVVQRLFEKGELAREKVGRHFEYWLVEKSKKDRGLLTRLKNKIFGGRSTEMISYLLEMDDEITSDELDELESLIQKRRDQERKR